MRKCVIAHPIACEGIGATPGTEVVFATTAEDFAEEIRLLLQDPARRERIGAAARELVATSYSFSSIGKQLADALENLAV